MDLKVSFVADAFRRRDPPATCRCFGGLTPKRLQRQRAPPMAAAIANTHPAPKTNGSGLGGQARAALGRRQLRHSGAQLGHGDGRQKQRLQRLGVAPLADAGVGLCAAAPTPRACSARSGRLLECRRTRGHLAAHLLEDREPVESAWPVGPCRPASSPASTGPAG